MSPIARIEEDGTVVYTQRVRYKPVPDAERKYARHKPADPRAVRFRANWYLPLEVIPDDGRQMPETRSDDSGVEHSSLCRCRVCQRPEAIARWRRHRGLRVATSASDPDPAPGPADP